jgi:hypothetical protein
MVSKYQPNGSPSGGGGVTLLWAAFAGVKIRKVPAAVRAAYLPMRFKASFLVILF